MSKVETLDQLLVHEIADLLLNHHKETQTQYARLQEIALVVGMQATQKTVCTAMKGLIAEGQNGIQEIPAGPVRDAAIIGSSQRVEHYEMAAYRGASSFAAQLGLDSIVSLLNQTLQEEAASDKLLTAISQENTPKALAAK